MPDVLCRGKRSIAINMKSNSGISLFKQMCKQVDVLIEPYRRGKEHYTVMYASASLWHGH